MPCVPADLYYGGDTFSVEQPQSFTCPYCGRMGFTETSLQDHVTSEHAETSTEVVSVPAVAQPRLPSIPHVHVGLRWRVLQTSPRAKGGGVEVRVSKHVSPSVATETRLVPSMSLAVQKRV